MTDVAEVRRFTRLVTQRVGVLNDHYLARDRPLGEARVLWEIGDGVDVRELRRRLDLDSGYLSRLLRRWPGEGGAEPVRRPGPRRERQTTARRTTVREGAVRLETASGPSS